MGSAWSMTVEDAGRTLFGLYCLGLVSAFVASRFYRVRADESLVRLHLGEVDPDSVRGPARVFVAPIIDRVRRVSLLPEHEILRDVPPVAPPGMVAEWPLAAVLIDVDVRYRVVDPPTFVANVLPPPAGMWAFVRAALTKALENVRPNDELTAMDLDRKIGPHVTALLLQSGATDVSVKVLSAKRGEFVEAQQPDREAFLRRFGVAFENVSDGPHSLLGDTAWAIRKVGRMMRWQPIVIAFTCLGIQLFRSEGDAWASSGLFEGLLFGIAASFMIELAAQDGNIFRRAGMRRASLWAGFQLVWTLALFAFVCVVLFLADRSAFVT
jgi:hypothetical protein